MTAPDGISPHIGWWSLAVVTDLVHYRDDVSMISLGLWEMAKRQVNLTA